MSKTQDNSRAFAAFVVRKSEIDVILAHLVRLSTEHFNLEPGEIIWADVGTVGSAHGRAAPGQRRRLHEGEHAP
jgi:hypothetical protein